MEIAEPGQSRQALLADGSQVFRPVSLFAEESANGLRFD
jgi:hypothetical protein